MCVCVHVRRVEVDCGKKEGGRAGGQEGRREGRLAALVASTGDSESVGRFGCGNQISSIERAKG